jgi:hypothetical protein
MLFKYLAPERIDVLQRLSIRFTPYNELNDPFECLFVLNPIAGEAERAIEDDYNAESAEVTVWLESRIAQLGLLSLTLADGNLLMWAHYAANHKGFLLAFDEEHAFFRTTASYIEPTYRTVEALPMPGFGTLRKVNYTTRRTTVDLGDNVPFEFFFTKSMEWSYEEEVRIFKRLKDADSVLATAAGPVHLFKIPPDCLRRVVLGANSTPELEDDVRTALRARELGHVVLDRAGVHPREFSLRLQRLTT